MTDTHAIRTEQERSSVFVHYWAGVAAPARHPPTTSSRLTCAGSELAPGKADRPCPEARSQVELLRGLLGS